MNANDFWGWLEWKYLDEICPLVKVPMLLKGILTVEDARMAIERGMDGIVVSNHGGRACDGATTGPLEASKKAKLRVLVVTNRCRQPNRCWSVSLFR